MLIARAEVEGLVRDVRVQGGSVCELGERLRPLADEDVVDAHGAALIPGLRDHHLHIRALAAASLSIQVGPPDVRDPTALARRLQAATPRSGWIRAIGYHDSVAGPIDAAALDAIIPHQPVRVQHRSGAMWILNSAAMATTGLAVADHPGVERDAKGLPTGRLFRMDDWLRRVTPGSELDLTAIGALEASRGVTGLTDATPAQEEEDVADLVQARASGALPQRLTLMAARVPEADGVDLGALKIVLDEVRLPGLDDLAAEIGGAHAGGRAVAIHCLTGAELLLALCALDVARPLPGDRLEHAALIPPEAIDFVRRLGVTVVTQPNFVSERGDAYRRDVPPADPAGPVPTALARRGRCSGRRRNGRAIRIRRPVAGDRGSLLQAHTGRGGAWRRRAARTR